MVDAQPVEGAVNVLTGLAGGPGSRFGREEEVLPVAGHPRSDTQLGVPVPRGGVDMVDAVPKQHVQRAVGIRLARSSQGRAAEERHTAEVAGSSERSPLDQARCFPNQARTFFHPSTAAAWR